MAREKEQATAVLEVPKTGQPLSEPFTLDEHPQQIRAKRQRFEDRYTEWGGKSCPEKTQIASDRQYRDGRSYAVCIPKNPEHPEVVIKAASKAQAVARYQKLCGIRGWDPEHQPVAAPISAAQESEIRAKQPFPASPTDAIDQEDDDAAETRVEQQDG